MILWANHEKQNRICPIREERADADSLITAIRGEAKLGNVTLCLHVKKKQTGFCQRTVVMCVKIPLQNSLGNCYSSCGCEDPTTTSLNKIRITLGE